MDPRRELAEQLEHHLVAKHQSAVRLFSRDPLRVGVGGERLRIDCLEHQLTVAAFDARAVEHRTYGGLREFLEREAIGEQPDIALAADARDREVGRERSVLLTLPGDPERQGVKRLAVCRANLDLAEQQIGGAGHRGQTDELDSLDRFVLGAEPAALADIIGQ